MRVLITSGGTRVKIDRVRHIGNMSQGTFGSKIAVEMMREMASDERNSEDHLIFLNAKYSKKPFSINLDVGGTDGDQDMMDDISKLFELRDLYYRFTRDGFYNQPEFVDFSDYEKKLEMFSGDKSPAGQPPDLIILACAASDFLVDNYVNGKIRSKDDLSIHLAPAEKLISKVKTNNPDCKLVGFKLLVDSHFDELIAAAEKSIVDNGCDLVIANDLRDIQNNDHIVHLVWPNGSVDTYESEPDDPNYLAMVVATNSMWLVDKNVDRP